MIDTEDQDWILLSTFAKFGPKRLTKLFNHFGSAKKIKEADIKEFEYIGIKKDIAQEFKNFARKINLEKILNTLEKENINFIKITDNAYPELLKHIYDPPFLLYYKGRLNLDQKIPLAIIGSRKHSYYGKQIADSIVPILAENHIAIISGMALGIDALAHKNALTKQGKTLAITGSGLDKDNIYPPQNRSLLDKIINSGGAIISEFPPGTPPLRQNFPLRNRIISGMSLGVFIIEAGTKSGTLITCKQALDQGREIFAPPGNIYSFTSKGTNNIIKQGAHVVTSPEDILNFFNIDLNENKTLNNKKKEEDYSPEECKILSFLSTEPIHLNQLIKLTELDTSTVNSTLTVLEIRGVIKHIGNKKYIKNK